MSFTKIDFVRLNISPQLWHATKNMKLGKKFRLGTLGLATTTYTCVYSAVFGEFPIMSVLEVHTPRFHVSRRSIQYILVTRTGCVPSKYSLSQQFLPLTERFACKLPSCSPIVFSLTIISSLLDCHLFRLYCTAVCRSSTQKQQSDPELKAELAQIKQLLNSKASETVGSAYPSYQGMQIQNAYTYCRWENCGFFCLSNDKSMLSWRLLHVAKDNLSYDIRNLHARQACKFYIYILIYFIFI